MASPELISSEVPNLDTLLGGGLQPRQMVLLAGAPGCGKTVLASQIAFGAAARGLPVVMATVSAEPHSKLLQSLEAFEFYSKERVGKEIFIVSAYPWVKKGGREARDVLISSVRDRKARLLVIDGLSGVRDLWQDESQIREFFAELGVGLATYDCMGLFTIETQLEKLLERPEAATVDGVVSMTQKAYGMQRRRRIEVVKLRGRPHLTGEHSLQIDLRGAVVAPRLETMVDRSFDAKPSGRRCSTGVAALDQLMEGGLPEGSSTVLLGISGTGKTLLSAHFLAAGAAAGEPGLLVSFSESPQHLLARCESVGLRLADVLQAKKLELQHVAPVEMDPDVIAHGILASVRRLGARRLVIDSLPELERAVADEARKRDFMAALRGCLQSYGVTSVLTVEAPLTRKREMSFGEGPLGSLAENLLFLGQEEDEGRFRRALSILKMRASGHSWKEHEFRISSGGFSLTGGAGE